MDPKFICKLYTPGEANVIVFGVPLGKNSKKAIKSLRETSDFLEIFDPDKRKNLLDDVRICDVGDLRLKKLEEISERVREILSVRKIPLILGGGHLLTLYSLKSFRDVKLVIFDAHADLKEEYEDRKIRELNFANGIKFHKRINDATWLRRACEFINPKNILLLGLRSCDEDEFKFIQDNGISYFTSNQIKDDIQKVKQFLSKFTENSKIYLSVDVDVFDPSIAPAVHHPEPNGINFKEFSELVNSLKGRIGGMDFVCLRYEKNQDQRTQFLVVRTCLEVLSMLHLNV